MNKTTLFFCVDRFLCPFLSSTLLQNLPWMTIDSGWVRVLKEEAPEAFSHSYPFQGVPKVAYIDGMPLLMASERTAKTWDDLLRNNYAKHIKRLFRWHQKSHPIFQALVRGGI